MRRLRLLPRFSRILAALTFLLAVGTAPMAPATTPAFVEGDFTNTLAWQIALEGHGYSPGILDGVSGPKTRAAVAAVQAALARTPTGVPDEELARLLGVSEATAISTYRITPADARQVAAAPSDWLERSRSKWLGYASLLDLVAERFHTSSACLARLNPGVDLASLRVGDGIRVPGRRPPSKRALPPVSWLEIDLERKRVLVIFENAAGQRFLHGLLHCSIAAVASRAPVGEFRVAAVAEDPEYTFDPADWPEVRGVDRRLRIPPGPRGPVGTRWIGLDRPGVGIHGTARPLDIGRTGSHGCFRLTNWDAEWLAGLVRGGTPVKVFAASRETSWAW